ncbi:hypothetical protein QTO30_00315 [Yoonia sp. GPGPB17]|uniref:hypothetical protein n=1 Tax=Yoonia sp. GPGPB17 TaxID=3026147 RepID=UPI0030C4BC63
MAVNNWALEATFKYENQEIELFQISECLERFERNLGGFKTGKVSYLEFKILLNDPRKVDDILTQLSEVGITITENHTEVRYFETTLAETTIDHTHKDFDNDFQSDRKFARVILSITPRDQHTLGNPDFSPTESTIVSNVVGGAIPRELNNHAIRGIERGLQNGPFVGGEIANVEVKLKDGAFHDTYSDASSFETAGREAVHLALRSAEPAILEPVLEYNVETDPTNSGNVFNFASSAKCQILSQEIVHERLQLKIACPASRTEDLQTALKLCLLEEDGYGVSISGFRVVDEVEFEELTNERELKPKFEVENRHQDERSKSSSKLASVLVGFLFFWVRSFYCEVVPTLLRPRWKVPVEELMQRVSDHELWLATDGEEGKRLELFWKKLDGWDVSQNNLDRCVLWDCDMRGARFAGTKSTEAGSRAEEELVASTLRFADLSYCRLERAVFSTTREQEVELRGSKSAIVTGTRFVGCSGVFGAEGAFFGNGLVFDPTEPPVVQRWWPGSSIGDFPSWNLISTFQNLRLLAVSNTLAIALVFYAALAKILNNNLETMKLALEEAPNTDSLASLVASIPPLPTPSHFGYLLLVVVALTVANILYNYLCPTSIGSQLTISSYSAYGSEVFQSLAARYNGLFGRWICFFSLGGCCAYIVYYLVQRVSEAVQVFLPPV